MSFVFVVFFWGGGGDVRVHAVHALSTQRECTSGQSSFFSCLCFAHAPLPHAAFALHSLHTKRRTAGDFIDDAPGYRSPYEFDLIGRNLLFMFLEGLLFFALNLALEWRRVHQRRRPDGHTPQAVEQPLNRGWCWCDFPPRRHKSHAQTRTETVHLTVALCCCFALAFLPCMSPLPPSLAATPAGAIDDDVAREAAAVSNSLQAAVASRALVMQNLSKVKQPLTQIASFVLPSDRKGTWGLMVEVKWDRCVGVLGPLFRPVISRCIALCNVFVLTQVYKNKGKTTKAVKGFVFCTDSDKQRDSQGGRHADSHCFQHRSLSICAV